MNVAAPSGPNPVRRYLSFTRIIPSLDHSILGHAVRQICPIGTPILLELFLKRNMFGSRVQQHPGSIFPTAVAGYLTEAIQWLRAVVELVSCQHT